MCANKKAGKQASQTGTREASMSKTRKLVVRVLTAKKVNNQTNKESKQVRISISSKQIVIMLDTKEAKRETSKLNNACT